jgi:NAD(P)-dependent dehydrogenase (short-subunit alcohol dehydrogenase family)
MSHWLVTGVSTGFGLELAKAALARGDTVVGTVRQRAQADSFEQLAPGRAHAVLLDVTRQADVEPAVQQAIRRAGHLDVLVNNAGYGLFGAVEEISDAEARDVMETNFFGALAVLRAVLPHFRERRGGHVFNVASVAGAIGFPGCGLYSASKFALEGMTEALAAELAPFGIRVTIVEPGGLRTEFSGGSLRKAGGVLDAYAGTPAARTRENIGLYHGNEPGDPAKAAAAVMQALDAPQPPLRLALGADAVRMLRGACEGKLKQLADWEAVSVATAFDTL